MLIRGGCHCGNIGFSLEWNAAPEIPARVCTCSFCRKHGGVWTSHPSSALEVTIREPALVSAYAFGTRTATFHVCAQCGVAPVVTSRIDDRLYAVVNVNTFENVAASALRHAPISFEEEGVDTRLVRRAHNWISEVRFVESGA